MVWRYFCDECGSEKEVAHLTISAEVSRGDVHMPEVQDGPQYESDLCSSCRQKRVMEFSNFIEGLKPRR